MPNYRNSKIYKLIDITNDECVYVGSTTNKYLSTRMALHRREYKTCPNRKVYKNIRQTCGIENVRIILIKNYPCDTIEELEAVEYEYIRELSSLKYHHCHYPVNSRTIKERNKQYYEDNKQTINAVCSCECGNTYTKSHKSRHVKSKKHLSYINPQ